MSPVLLPLTARQHPLSFAPGFTPHASWATLTTNAPAGALPAFEFGPGR